MHALSLNVLFERGLHPLLTTFVHHSVKKGVLQPQKCHKNDLSKKKIPKGGWGGVFIFS